MLRGKKVLITGGSRGIGRAISLKLAEAGAEIFINFLQNKEAATETKRLVEQKGVNAHIFQANMGDHNDIKNMFAELNNIFVELDILIHNAALGSFKPLIDTKSNQWDLTFNINAKALLLLSQEAVKLMKNGGKIIAISSTGSHRYTPSYGAIGISKAALEAVVKYLAVELAPKGIRVNAVSGGPIETEAIRLHPMYKMIKNFCEENTPGKRLGTTEDIANVVLFLASEESNWIYGQTIIADGGLTLI